MINSWTIRPLILFLTFQIHPEGHTLYSLLLFLLFVRETWQKGWILEREEGQERERRDGERRVKREGNWVYERVNSIGSKDSNGEYSLTRINPFQYNESRR